MATPHYTVRRMLPGPRDAQGHDLARPRKLVPAGAGGQETGQPGQAPRRAVREGQQDKQSAPGEGRFQGRTVVL